MVTLQGGWAGRRQREGRRCARAFRPACRAATGPPPPAPTPQPGRQSAPRECEAPPPPSTRPPLPPRTRCPLRAPLTVCVEWVGGEAGRCGWWRGAPVLVGVGGERLANESWAKMVTQMGEPAPSHLGAHPSCPLIGWPPSPRCYFTAPPPAASRTPTSPHTHRHPPPHTHGERRARGEAAWGVGCVAGGGWPSPPCGQGGGEAPACWMRG